MKPDCVCVCGCLDYREVDEGGKIDRTPVRRLVDAPPFSGNCDLYIYNELPTYTHTHHVLQNYLKNKALCAIPDTGHKA